jgi:hypothetical protein
MISVCLANLFENDAEYAAAASERKKTRSLSFSLQHVLTEMHFICFAFPEMSTQIRSRLKNSFGTCLDKGARWVGKTK